VRSLFPEDAGSVIDSDDAPSIAAPVDSANADSRPQRTENKGLRLHHHANDGHLDHFLAFALQDRVRSGPPLQRVAIMKAEDALNNGHCDSIFDDSDASVQRVCVSVAFCDVYMDA